MENRKVNFKDILSERLLNFASKIFDIEKQLCKSFAGRHIFGQLFRSGTSSGANYEESIGAQSKADFIHKTQIVLKEMRESNYWLRLVAKTNIIREDNADLNFLLKESDELVRIFSSSIITAKNVKK